MNLKKAVSAVMLLAMGVGSVITVKGSEQLKNWVGELAENMGLSSERADVQADKSDEASADAVKSALPASTIDDSFPPFPSDVEIPEASEAPLVSAEPAVVLPTTIEGGMVIRNDTSFEIQIESLLREGPSQKLSRDGIHVLIIHTHGSEAYTSEEGKAYKASDTYRTEDKEYNVVRVGDELAACLESYGINVIHDREIYDYPSYTGSYGRSAEAIERSLSEHPEISVVIDLHRDALGSGGVVYKTVAEGDGQQSSQVMLLVGTGENGLPHPNWVENMKLALYLQSAVVEKYPSLARPISLKKERYNQQLTTGSLILEVGSSGNTLDEALQAVRLFADAVAPALIKLIEA